MKEEIEKMAKQMYYEDNKGTDHVPWSYYPQAQNYRDEAERQLMWDCWLLY